jgi:endonuclease YncB( thermonuclease family)
MNLIVALLALIAPVAALAQWAGTPPYIEAPNRAEREAPFQARIQHLSDGDSFVVRTEDGRRIPVRPMAMSRADRCSRSSRANRSPSFRSSATLMAVP